MNTGTPTPGNRAAAQDAETRGKRTMNTRLRIATAVTAALAGLVLAGCTPSDGTTGTLGGHPTATYRPTPTSTHPATQPPAVAHTTQPPKTTRYPTDPTAYTRAAVAAWFDHDATKLSEYEPSTGVLHHLPSSTYMPIFLVVKTEGAAGSTYVTLGNSRGDVLILRLRNETLGRAQAIQVSGSSLHLAD